MTNSTHLGQIESQINAEAMYISYIYIILYKQLASSPDSIYNVILNKEAVSVFPSYI